MTYALIALFAVVFQRPRSIGAIGELDCGLLTRLPAAHASRSGLFQRFYIGVMAVWIVAVGLWLRSLGNPST